MTLYYSKGLEVLFNGMPSFYRTDTETIKITQYVSGRGWTRTSKPEELISEAPMAEHSHILLLLMLTTNW